MADTIYTREHVYFTARAAQLDLNSKANKGGRPYVRARLWRALNESDLSWNGASQMDDKLSSSGRVGRQDRAMLVNDAGRVVSKISQYLFKKTANRTGIDDVWAKNVDGRGRGVNDYWLAASEELTVGQWLWMQVDRAAPLVDPDTGMTRTRTVLEKQRDNDTVRWTIWPATSVPDWCFGDDGRLLWIITQDSRYDNSDPFTEPKKLLVRTLWRKTTQGVEVSEWLVRGENSSTMSEARVTGLSEIPFVILGTPSDEPWWFDDVEGLQAQLLNLDSLHVENLVKTVYPQLVIPASMLESLTVRLSERLGNSSSEQVAQIVRELLRGLDTPLVESGEDKNVTRFLQPSAADLKSLPDEITRKRQLIFDTVGLSLFNRETRLIQTAESKQFDQLDTESTLKHRAQVMQEAEERMISMSKLVDPMWRNYEVVWPTSFDVVDPEKDASAITMIANLPDITDSMRKLVLQCALRLLEESGGNDRTLIAAARDEISVLGVGADGTDGVTDTTGKIQLAIQQLSLARDRYAQAGDTARAAQLDAKITELLVRV